MVSYKSLKSLIIATFSLCIFGSVVLAQSSGSPLDYFTTLLAQDFGYITQNISVKSISSTGVVFESAVLRDKSNNDIKKYVVTYGPYSISKLIDGGPSVSFNDFEEKTFIFTGFSGTTFVMPLTLADGIKADTFYYVIVTPVDKDGVSGQVSGLDVCFRLEDQVHGLGNDCPGLDSGSVHSSAGANMGLANVTHTRNGNNITLRWTAVSGAPKVEIFLMNTTTQKGTKLVTKNMSDETYTFPLTVQPPQVVRFVPVTNNGTTAGTEKDYTMHEKLGGSPSTSTTPKKPGVPTVPTVGPKQDMLFILFLSLFVYGIVRFVQSKRKT